MIVKIKPSAMKAFSMKYGPIFICSLFIFSIQAQQNLSISEIDSLNTLGKQYTYVQKDSAYHFFEKASLLSKEIDNQEIKIQTLFNFINTASYHHDLKIMEVSLKELENIIGTLADYDQPILDENIYLLTYYKGLYGYLISATQDAILTFQGIVDNINKIPAEKRTADLNYLLSGSYTNMGALYSEQGKFNLAKELYLNNIRINLLTASETSDYLYGNYSLLAQVYINQNKYKEANQYLHKSLNYNKNKNNTNAFISTAFYLSQNYIQLKKQDSALYYLNQAKLSFNDNPAFYPEYHLIKADIHKSIEEYSKALLELELSLKEIQDRFDNEKSLNVANVRNKMADILAITKNDDKALLNYDLALKELEEKYKNTLQFIEISKNKAWHLNENMNKYQDAISTVKQASEILDILKPSFKNNADKLSLIENAFPLFEAGAEAGYQMFDSTEQPKYIDRVFDFSEKGKSVLLLEALLGAKATQFADIPNDILERELQLKSEITFVEKQLNQYQETDSKKEDALFALQEEYRQLIETIETDYKTYYDLKYNTKTPSIAAIQKLLAEDEKFISYFYGNDAIYAIGIAKNSKQIERISIDASFENTIREVHQLLGNPKSDISALSKSSLQLYNTLVAPFMTSEAHQKLVIVADGLLNYIPFGALNTSEKNPEYLMEKFAISYANSATLYEQLLERNAAEGDLLAFAPSFNGEQVQIDPSRDSLLPLPHNKREVEQILTSFEGRSFVDENASLQNFTSELSNFSMLHLATHAVFDDAAPEYSYLAFSNSVTEDNLLYVSDLYNLQIDADLVTLSACETGIGELKRGEGFLSLARGFFYSGASSIASTLWKVNDASATTLMGSFYKNLSEGNTKDIALQKAKQKFLKTNRQNGLAHPYYWSGFIISGNAAAVVETDYFVWIVLIGLTLILVGFLVFRKKRMH